MAAQENHIEVVRFLLEHNSSQSMATEVPVCPLPPSLPPCLLCCLLPSVSVSLAISVSLSLPPCYLYMFTTILLFFPLSLHPLPPPLFPSPSFFLLLPPSPSLLSYLTLSIVNCLPPLHSLSPNLVLSVSLSLSPSMLHSGTSAGSASLIGSV